ncbi:YraN family protein [uncultured Roseovarius sp.]|uniref:YraN family protein n=1 Tax=uncultured Roseovarius sp. TaxID=293344 RepID=UPI0026295A0D|nr:YraN family protein [uncultured Roseovarius sp.]
MTDDQAQSEVAAVARRDAGQRAELSGRAAEDRVAVEYARLGYALIETRWRGAGGEVDLIFGQGELLVFTEVKKARSIDAAICSLRPAQMRRIHAAASEYLARTPNGQLSDVRFDLAAMDGTGRVQIFENAFSHF